MGPLLGTVGFILFALIGVGVLIALSLYATALVTMELFITLPVGKIMATTVWGASSSWSLTALPLFIWMGEILFRSRLSDEMFKGVSPWTASLPGRLAHVNIIGCGIFAAVSGSSAATCATIGKMSIPELRRRGYGDSLLIGSLCGAGTMGLMIPPSIMMIVYGVAAEVSIVRLFTAGIIPGLMLILGMMLTVMLWSVLDPKVVPKTASKMGFFEKVRMSRHFIPVCLLILAVLGSIYSGVATPTEAAAVGVTGSLLLSYFAGTLTWKSFVEGALGAAKTTCMICFILACAAFLSSAMTLTGLPRMLAEIIYQLELSPFMLIFALTILYMSMGCILDGVSMVVLTTSIVLPLIQQAGFDLVWFGIYIILVVEMAQITPPLGINLYVLQGMTGRDILFISMATVPFLLVLIVATVIIVIWPELVMFLPDHLFGQV